MRFWNRAYMSISGCSEKTAAHYTLLFIICSSVQVRVCFFFLFLIPFSSFLYQLTLQEWGEFKTHCMSYQTLLGLCYVIHYTSKSGQFIIVRAHNSYNELALYHELCKQCLFTQVYFASNLSTSTICHNVLPQYLRNVSSCMWVL